MNKVIVSSLILAGVLTGCQSIQTTPFSKDIMLVNEKPQGNCQFLGEAIGTQGNFLTGEFTQTAKLLQGARNDLRNKAYAEGGNLVHVQETHTGQAEDSLGTGNVVIIGHVYKCKN